MRDELRPSRIGAPGSLNVATINGRGMPAFASFRLDATDKLHYAVKAIEYKAPTSTGGQPRQFCAIDRKVKRLDNGAETNDTENFDGSNDQFNSVIQGMVIYDVPADDAPGTFTQGNAGLIVSFGNGNPDPANTSHEGVYYRQLSTDASTPWTKAGEATQGTTYLTCYQMVKAGPDLYAVCDAGTATGIGDYRISKCPAGNNPVLVASWGNGIEVGGPEWIITGLAAIGASPVVGKPDGLWYYNEQTRRYENVMKHLELIPHALNGKCMESVTGGVIYTTHDGHAYFFDGTVVQEVSPNKYWPILSRDIGNSRITAVADAGDVVYLYTELAYQTVQDPIHKIYAVDSSLNATDMTANLIDGSFNTGSGTALDSFTSGSFIDIWADIPFEGAIFHTTRSPNSTAAAVFTNVYRTTANDTFTEDTEGLIDGTRISSGGSFSYTAYPPSASAGVVTGKSITFGSTMTAVNFNYTTGTDITGKYGMRIRMAGGSFDSDTEIDEVEIIPWRAGLKTNADGVFSTAAQNFTNRDRAGLVGHVIALKRERTTGFVPHDSYAVYSYPGVWAMAMHTGRLGKAGGVENLGQNLILWGRYSTWAINMSPTRNELRTRYPVLSSQDATVSPRPLQQLCYDWDGGRPEKLKKLNSIFINTQFVDPDMLVEIFAQFDNRDSISLGVSEGGPVNLKVHQGAFRFLNLWLGFNGASDHHENAAQWIEPYILDFDFVEGDVQQDPHQSVPVSI